MLEIFKPKSDFFNKATVVIAGAGPSDEKNLVNKNTMNAMNDKYEDISHLKKLNQASSQIYPKNLVSQKLPETFKAKYYIGSKIIHHLSTRFLKEREAGKVLFC